MQIKPLMPKPTPFSYHVGNVDVDYKPSGTSRIQVPTAPGVRKEYRLHGMVAGGAYSVAADGACAALGEEATASADGDGVLAFVADGSCGGVRVALAAGQ